MRFPRVHKCSRPAVFMTVTRVCGLCQRQHQSRFDRLNGVTWGRHTQTSGALLRPLAAFISMPVPTP